MKRKGAGVKSEGGGWGNSLNGVGGRRGGGCERVQMLICSRGRISGDLYILNRTFYH